MEDVGAGWRTWGPDGGHGAGWRMWGRVEDVGAAWRTWGRVGDVGLRDDPSCAEPQLCAGSLGFRG